MKIYQDTGLLENRRIYIKCRIIHIASLSTIFIPYIVVTWKEKVVYRLPETPRTKT